MPANLYGRGDNFDLESSHVLPALVKKFTLAKINNLPYVEVWGSGKVKRIFKCRRFSISNIFHYS